MNQRNARCGSMLSAGMYRDDKWYRESKDRTKGCPSGTLSPRWSSRRVGGKASGLGGANKKQREWKRDASWTLQSTGGRNKRGQIGGGQREQRDREEEKIRVACGTPSRQRVWQREQTGAATSPTRLSLFLYLSFPVCALEPYACTYTLFIRVRV